MKNNEHKTLLLVTPYFPPHPGGLEKYAEAFALRLQKLGWRVVIATSSDDGKDSKESHNGLTIYRLKTLVKLSNTPFSPFWIAQLRRIIRDEQPDLINAHAPVPGMADAAALVAGKIPFVVTYHSGSMKKGGSGLIDTALGLYERFFLPRMFAKASRLISSSEFLRTGFLKKYQDKITTVTPGVDTSLFAPNSQLSTLNPPNILFVGDHVKATRYKGLDYLIEAVSMLSKKIPNVRLTVIGRTDEPDYYQDLCEKMQVKDKVRMLGPMGDERVKYFQDASVFALPTSKDNFPMVIAEALSCGVPVVSTPIGNIPLMVEDGRNGFLVPTKNAKALAEKLEKLLTDPKLHAQFSQAARAKAVGGLSWDSRVAATDQLFTKLIKGASPKIYQISAYFPPHVGGVEQVVKSLSEKLIDLGYRVQVLTTDSVEKRRITPQKHVKFLKSFEFAHTPLAPTLPWHLLKIKRNSVVHLHIAQAYFPEAVWLASKIKRFPYVAHFHLDVQSSSSFGFIFNFYKKVFLGRILRSAQKVIVFSEPQKKLVTDLYHVSPDKITIIPNGISNEFFNTQPSTLNPQPSTLHVLYVGRLSSQKRVERLIEAAPFIRHKVVLDIVGDGEDRQELEHLAKDLHLKNVHFHGAKDKNDLIKFYQRSDIFVLPSDQEGMPLVLLEAMAAGLPIIGSDVIGIHELIKDSGILVEPSPRHFAAAIDQLLSSPDLMDNLRQKSRAKAAHFSWNHLANRFEKLYQEVSHENH